MKKPLIAILLLALASFAAWRASGWFLKDDGGLKLYGNVDIRGVDLGFRVGGRLGEVLKDEGDAVKAGEVIARVDSQPYRHELAKAEAELAAARALLQQQQGANATLAQENYQLKTALARDPNASRRVVNAIPRETPPPATADARTVHTVVGGDSLSKISQLYYGTPSRWQEIYNANRAILGPTGALSVGTVLRIP